MRRLLEPIALQDSEIYYEQRKEDAAYDMIIMVRQGVDFKNAG